MNTLLVNPPLVNGVAFTRQRRCQEREEVLGTTKPPYSLLVCAALFRERSLPFRFVDQTARRLTTEQVIAELLAYWRLGIDEFILSGYPHDDECRRVASTVLPGLRDAIRREP